MAAYATLVNLLNILDQIQDHPRLSITLQQNQIQLLTEKLHFLLHFIETGPVHRGCEEEAQVLENQITSATYAAEDVIETHVVDQIQAACGSLSLLDLQTVIQDMDYVKEKVVTFKHQIKYLKPTFYPSSDSTSLETPLSITGKGKMVGFDDELYQLMDALTGRQSTLQIITIVGMGGIGKTTLAKNVYQRLLKSKHFDICAWATISQEYNINHIFSNLLSRKSKSTVETEDQKLALELYQSLIGRRYLIVLDDMWSIGVWDKIKDFFPDNNNGSRVVVTTRQSDMATCFSTLLLPLKLLDLDKSWELFCEKAFPQEGYCPSDLEVFGKKIVKKCGGLPLLVVVIGALLRKSSMTVEYWEDISDDINSILNSGEEKTIKSLDILCLSYRHLPANLKPCFLYIVTFPEDHAISVSILIKLWVAEGFVRSNKTQSLEEVARSYLKDLSDRSLLVLRTDYDGTRKTCQMHDLLRDLCLKIAKKENFLCVIRASDIPQEGIVNKGRRIVFEEGALPDGLKSASPLTRSLISDHSHGNFCSIRFKLLRLSRSIDLSGTLKQLVNLRYYRTAKSSPLDISSIFLLWNLQTLIITEGKRLVAPPGIWEMKQLRNVKIWNLHLPDPPSSSNQPADNDVVVLRSLMTLSLVIDLKLSEEVCKRIPNVKKLRLRHSSGSMSCDFGRLHKLEYLRFWFVDRPNLNDLLQNLTFPSSLRKLWLSGCGLRWEDLSMIGSLPRLEVLKLRKGSVIGTEWNPVEGEFRRLKSLWIECNDLKNWNADRFNFPLLEVLFLSRLKNLNEVPLGVGEIPTLGSIGLSACSESAAISAMEMLGEQEALGNDDLQVRIRFSTKVQLTSFKKKVQHMECFTSTNLQFQNAWR